jgi:hypothetical protein
MKTATALHLSKLVVYLDRHLSGNSINNPAQTIHEAHRLAMALHKRYVEACNYERANTPAYKKRTEKLEQKLIRHMQAAGFELVEQDYELPYYGLYFNLQTDPRGWPLILNIGGRVNRVGGEA